jgi:hypothetical protein
MALFEQLLSAPPSDFEDLDELFADGEQLADECSTFVYAGGSPLIELEANPDPSLHVPYPGSAAAERLKDGRLLKEPDFCAELRGAYTQTGDWKPLPALKARIATSRSKWWHGKQCEAGKRSTSVHRD